MAQVTKVLDAQISGINIAVDGKEIFVSVNWIDTETKQSRGVLCAQVTAGKLKVANKDVADAPLDLAKLAEEVTKKIKSLVDGCVASGAIKF